MVSISFKVSSYLFKRANEVFSLKNNFNCESMSLIYVIVKDAKKICWRDWLSYKGENKQLLVTHVAAATSTDNSGRTSLPALQ